MTGCVVRRFQAHEALVHRVDAELTTGSWADASPDTGKTYDAGASIVVTTAAPDPTFTLSAAAVDLDAWLWNRPGFGGVTTTGDVADLDRFATLVSDGVQRAVCIEWGAMSGHV